MLTTFPATIPSIRLQAFYYQRADPLVEQSSRAPVADTVNDLKNARLAVSISVWPCLALRPRLYRSFNF
jgi:hypothetical protein